MMGCSNKPVDHLNDHNRDFSSHTIQLNISTWRAWCHQCSTEVLLTNNIPAVRGAFGSKRHPLDLLSANNEMVPDSYCGLVGLYNLGNTCYMNAAIQCLSNIPALTDHFLTCPDLIPKNIQPNLSLAYSKLMVEMWKQSAPNSIEPTGVLQSIKSVFPAFRGYQQHDSQEFLRCMMDQLHKELSEPIIPIGEDVVSKPSEENDAMGSLSEIESNGSTGSEQADEYKTASERSNKKRKHEDQPDRDSGLGSSTRMPRKCESDAGFGAPIFTCDTLKQGSAVLSGSPGSLSDQEYLDAKSETALSSSESGSPLRSEENGMMQLRHHKPRSYRSIVTDLFDGKLVSSVKCLSCDRISRTTETFQDLSLPIPSQEALLSISQRHHGLGSDDAEGWVSWAWRLLSSWFYGPDVTLQDCLAFFFSEDELKEDNMYSCERCKKLRNGLKFSEVIQLPDTLCVHLKRFRHDFAFSSKISTRVAFPLSGLDLSPWVHKDCVSLQTVYDLTGVICHHGTSGGGHYTSYCYNHKYKTWYHFDDKLVTQVDPGVVSSAEAYVLFYRKNGDHLSSIRREFHLHSKDSNVSLVKYFVSNPWLVKFQNMSEPGEIDNGSVLCRHGGVLPQRIDAADRLCTALTPSAWRKLYERFGGSAAVTALNPCQVCLHVSKEEEKQRLFELNEFKLLQKQDKIEMNSMGDTYLLVTSWFSTWESWVLGKAREPPGPINNRSLYIQRGNTYSLRPNIDHFKLSEDIWSLFLSLYSGGPEVVIRAAGGGLKVTNPRPQRIKSIAARLQARCNETSIASWIGTHSDETEGVIDDTRSAEAKSKRRLRNIQPIC